jgi:predicted dienelactone hydrolase
LPVYDPFVRGRFPVGVRSGRAIDAKRERRQLPFEVWYPAAPHAAGLDLDPATQDRFRVQTGSEEVCQAAVREAAVHDGRYPLVLYSHTSGGHRRQASVLCTHLASHGYVVAAVDHTGNTAADLTARREAAGAVDTPEERDARVRQLIGHRVPDLRFLLDELLARAAGDLSGQIDPRRIGLVGASFGGWAVLATPEAEDRISAVVAMAPAGNSRPLPGIIPCTLTFAWRREVPTLILAAERDTATPLPGVYELFERTPCRKGMFILRGAGHGHFGDQIDEDEHCRREHAYQFTRSLCLAHLDAVLKQSQPAERFMAGAPAAALRERGIDAIAYDGREEAVSGRGQGL